MSELKRELTFRSLVFITVIAVLGLGLFFLPAIAAKEAGTASLISWLVFFLLAIYAVSALGELSALFPSAGGIYEYCKHAYGKFFSFLIAWLSWLTSNILVAMLIVGAMEYLLPTQSLDVVLAKAIISIAWVVLFSYMAYKGMKVSKALLIIFSLIAIIAAFSITFPALLSLDVTNFTPFFIPASNLAITISLFIALFFICLTFFALMAVPFFAEETKEPEKSFPKALILGTVLAAVITLFTLFAAMGMSPASTLSDFSMPFASAAGALFSNLGKELLLLSCYFSIIGAAAVLAMSSSRLVFSLARDKLVPQGLAYIHPGHGTPSKAIFFQAVMMVLFVLTSFFGHGFLTLMDMLIPIVLFIVSATIFAVPLLRIMKPGERRFKVKFAFVGILLAVLFNLTILALWLLTEPGAFYTLWRAFFLTWLSIPLFILVILYHDERTIVRVNDALAYIVLFFENINMPASVRNEVLRLLGDISNKKVYEYGCSVGTLTVELAKAVLPEGKVYASDISRHEVNVLKDRMKKLGHIHVEAFHDEHHHKRLHEKVPEVDAIVSVGSMGYMENPSEILKKMHALLPKGGDIVLVDYVDFFKIIPNVEWMDTLEKMRKTFEEAGFTVHIEKKEGVFWNYVYVHGKKV